MKSMVVALLLLLLPPPTSSAQSVLDGDIIFQNSDSAQTPAIQLATKSKYSHCGVLLFKDGKPFVFEAASRVRYSANCMCSASNSASCGASSGSACS